MSPYRLLIGGDWVEGGSGSYDVVNPATEDVVDEAPEASATDAREAAAAARAALPAWSRTSPQERAALLQAVADRVRQRADELLPLIIAETGATLSVGSALQVPMCANRFERYAKGALQDLTIAIPPMEMQSTPLAPGGLMGAVGLRPPVGVVACITPYNFPITSMAGKVAPALATGNTVVIKPAPHGPLAVIELVRIIEEVGFPPGVVNLVTGSQPDPGAALVDSPDVDMISFTGSTAVGVKIYESGARTMKRLLLELGGKGACIVCDDADLTAAVTALGSVWGFHSGQICTAPTRAVVQRSVYDEVVERLAKLAPQMKVGDPLEVDTVVGPVISAAQRDRIEGHIRGGTDAGAELIAGGVRPAHLEKGFYVEPALLAACTNDMRVARDEIFGPVLVVIPYDDDDEAVAIANDSEYGLSAGVWSRDRERALRVARQLESGTVWINDWHMVNAMYPFGGFKQSGIGRELGPEALGEYVESKFVHIDMTNDRSRRAYAAVVSAPVE